ncbi:MAG: two-component system cell cycle sensor histidine kinase/response regulator CckA [Granulosicoccus sp.]
MKPKRPTANQQQLDDAAKLRLLAEAQLRGQSLEEDMPLSVLEMQKLVHELKNHQIELEMQNDELQRIQLELDASQKRYFNLYNLAPIGYFTLSDEGLILEANLASAKILNVTRSVLINQNIKKFVSFMDQDIYYFHHNSLMETRKRQVCDIHMNVKGGEPIWTRLEQIIEPDDEGRPLYRLLMSAIAEFKKNELALQESEAKYRSLFEQAGDGILIGEINNEGVAVIIDVNSASLLAHGYSREEIIGQPITTLDSNTNPETANIRVKTLQIAGKLKFEVANTTKNGTSIVLAVTASMVTIADKQLILYMEHDITDRKAVEEQQQRAAKLESVGILAGGIAHDFNNILMGLFGYMELAEMYLSQDHVTTAKGMLTKAGKESIRAKALTQQLLTFAKGGAPISKPTHIEQLIRNSTNFCLGGSNAQPTFDIADGLWAVEIDTGQIDQVVTNLVINADQAMIPGGSIHISASNIVVGKQSDLPLPTGDYIRIDIADQGTGILKEHQNKIFDPYFTTKQAGSGLGLAGSYSIIKNHDGYINFETEIGVGTTFHIYLPASQEVVKDIEQAAVTEPTSARGKILVMDDQESMRDLIRRMLSHSGYEVSLSKDGAEALKKHAEAKASGRPFAAVILDLTIPGGMGGRETMETLLPIDPGVIGIVSSGYTTDPTMAKFKQYGFRGVVRKPYHRRQLLSMLHDLLEA